MAGIGVVTDTNIPQIREHITAGIVIVAVATAVRFALAYTLVFRLAIAVQARPRRWAGAAAVAIGLLTPVVGYAAVWLARLP